MIYIECNIENFGKLSGFNKNFNNGLNVVLEDNGFGKTTFAAFLAAMFYGLDSGRSKDSERNRYYPWQGGKYGGSIVFSADGKTYRVERFFGKKEKDDTFALYNEETGMASEDYTENIGCELFGIDKKSYEKCCYIPQGKIEANFSDAGDINAKLSNLLESENDLASFDIAVDRLKKLENRYKRKGGEISEAESLKSELEDIIRYTENLTAAESELKDKIADKKALRKQLREKIEKIHKAEAKKEKAQHYAELLRDIDASEFRIKEMTEKFKSVPSTEELAALSELTEEYKKCVAVRNANKLSKTESEDICLLEEELSGRILTESEYEAIKKDIADYRAEKIIVDNAKLTAEEEKRLEYLNNCFLNNRPDEAELDEIYHSIWSLKEQQNREKQAKKSFLPYILCVILLISGGILWVTAKSYYGLIPIALSLVTFMAYFITQKQKTKKNKEELLGNTAQLTEIKNLFSSFGVTFEENAEEAVREVKKMLTELSALESKKDFALEFEEKSRVKALREKLNASSALCFDETFTDGVTEECFSELHKKYVIYKSLTEKSKNFEIANKNVENAYDVLENYSTKFIDTAAEKAYEELLLAVTKLEEEKKSSKLKSERLKEFIAENGIPDPDYESEFSRQELFAANSAYDELEETISELNNKLDKSIEKTERIPEYKADLEAVEEELVLLKRKLFIIEKASVSLIKAKENLAAKYIGPLAEKFDKYRRLLSDNDTFKLDIELNVGFTEHGEKHTSASLSTGLKDTISIALRFALTDALFEGEKPVVVLDDPFTNMDEIRIERAKKMLDALSEEYQILYLTCHESRC